MQPGRWIYKWRSGPVITYCALTGRKLKETFAVFCISKVDADVLPQNIQMVDNIRIIPAVTWSKRRANARVTHLRHFARLRLQTLGYLQSRCSDQKLYSWSPPVLLALRGSVFLGIIAPKSERSAPPLNSRLWPSKLLSAFRWVTCTDRFFGCFI